MTSGRPRARNEGSGGSGTPAPALQPDIVRAFEGALADRDAARVSAMVSELHAADVADLIQFIAPDARPGLVDAIRGVLNPEVLAELDDDVRGRVVEQLGASETALALADLETDEAIEVLETLKAPVRRAVIDSLDADQRAAVEDGLSYPGESAGRLMQRDLVAVPGYWTLGQTIDYLRETKDLPDEFYEIFVTDPSGRPVGTLSLNRAMRTKRPVVISSIMDAAPRLIPIEMDQEDVAFVFMQYDIASAGVVDDAGRLVGVIMVDDVLDVIDEEAEEDMFRLGGVGETRLNDPILTTTRRRAPWLLVNLLTAVLASIVIAVFSGTIEEIVALAVLMPIVASMGGNAGTQTLTITVRALATHDLTAANAARLFNKELAISLINGILFAAVTGAVAFAWFDSAGLGLVIVAAMIVNMVVAGLAGMLIPLGLNRIGVDPALAATVFVTTVTDVVGFSAFLGLAAWLLI
jgi:magnesium transporter